MPIVTEVDLLVGNMARDAQHNTHYERGKILAVLVESDILYTASLEALALSVEAHSAPLPASIDVAFELVAQRRRARRNAREALVAHEEEHGR